MQWQLFVSAFTSVFLAELGDKTQLTTMSLAASGGSRWSVFAGSALALVLSSLLAVVLGGVVQRYVPIDWIRRAAGVVFIVLGVIFIWPRAAPPF